MSSNYKVESGLQLLARLRKKPTKDLYPILFENGLKNSEVVELYSEESLTCLLADIISEALIPTSPECDVEEVLLLNTDGNLSFEILLKVLKKKLATRCQLPSKDVNIKLHKVLQSLYILDVYNSTQFYATTYNLESVLMENPNISLVIFDTLTAFYWSEQGFKITKMDIYLKSLLKIVQSVTKEYNVKILYTRPEYFSSSKDIIENLEACSKNPTTESLNYRMQVVHKDGNTYQVNVRTSDKVYNKLFNITDDIIQWLK